MRRLPRAALAMALLAASLGVAVASAPGAGAHAFWSPVAEGADLLHVGVSPDGTRYLAALDNTSLVTVDTATGEVVATLAAVVTEPWEAQFTPDSLAVLFTVPAPDDGETLTVAGADGGAADALFTPSPAGSVIDGYQFHPASNRVVAVVVTPGGTRQVWSVPIVGGAATELVDEVPVGDEIAIHGDHVVTGPGLLNPAGAVSAVPVAGGTAVTLDPEATLLTFTSGFQRIDSGRDHVLYQPSGGGTVTRAVGEPVVFTAGTVDTARIEDLHVTADELATATPDEVVVERLDGSSVWTIDTSGLPGVSRMPLRTATGVFWVQTAAVDEFQGQGYWAPIAPTDLTPTPVPVPEATQTNKFGISHLADGRLVYAMDPVDGHRSWRVWSPGDVAAQATPVLGWVDSGPQFEPGWAVAGTSLVVGGDGQQIVEVDLDAPTAEAVLLEATALWLDRAVPAADGGIVYTLVAERGLGVCLGTVSLCPAVGRVWRDLAVPSSATMLDAPVRIMDTRAAGVTVDGAAQGEGPVGSAGNDPFGTSTYRLVVHGRAGVPVGAVAAVVNVSAVRPDGPGFLALFPCGGTVPVPPTPVTASLNFRAGVNAVANNALVGLDGELCILANRPVDVVVDLLGWFPSGSDFVPVAPIRVTDTRPGGVVADGWPAGGGPEQALDTLVVPVAGVGGIPADISAVAVNLSAVRPSANGFAVLWPCDQPRPTASSLNFPGGVNAQANAGVVGLATSTNRGSICVHTNVATDLVLDITGWFPANARYTTLTPGRVMDTRPGGAPNVTVDGVSEGEGMLGVSANGTSRSYELTVAGRAGVPAAGLDAVALNVAAVTPVANGFVSVTPGPCAGSPPATATVNYTAGVPATTNGVLVGVSPAGTVCITANTDTHVVVDVTGYVPGEE